MNIVAKSVEAFRYDIFQFQMLVLVGTMIGCALFSYGLQTRLDELPDRAEKLEARLTDFETSLTTTNTALASTAACTAGVTTSVIINYCFYLYLVLIFA